MGVAGTVVVAAAAGAGELTAAAVAAGPDDDRGDNALPAEAVAATAFGVTVAVAAAGVGAAVAGAVGDVANGRPAAWLSAADTITGVADTSTSPALSSCRDDDVGDRRAAAAAAAAANDIDSDPDGVGA